MEINIPAVHAEVTDAFWHYTNALNASDLDTATRAFWYADHTLRYGAGENLYGYAAIAAFRGAQRGRRLTLAVTRLVITTFGHDFGTANCEIERSDTGGTGRMSHTWVRFDDGWRIVAAHVSHGPAV